MYDGLEVFSATLASEREKIGERVTRFLIEHPDLMVVNTEVRQALTRAITASRCWSSGVVDHELYPGPDRPVQAARRQA